MKISSLEYFIAIAESRSINEASKKLFIAQSSLTKSLRLLEEELGVQLFNRSTAGISLTETGRKILPEARQVVDYYRGWRALSAEAVPEQISLYMHSSFSDLIIPDVLMRFRKHYPDLPVEYTSMLVPEAMISRSIVHPVISLCVVRDENDLASFSMRQNSDPVLLMKGEYTALVSCRSSLSGEKSIRRTELSGKVAVLPVSISDTEKAASPDGFYDLFGQNPVIVDTLLNVLNIVSRDPDTYAISFMPALYRYQSVRDGRLVSIPIEGEPVEAALYMFYSHEAGSHFPAVRELVSMIRSGFREFLESLPGQVF